MLPNYVFSKCQSCGSQYGFDSAIYVIPKYGPRPEGTVGYHYAAKDPPQSEELHDEHIPSFLDHTSMIFDQYGGLRLIKY